MDTTKNEWFTPTIYYSFTQSQFTHRFTTNLRLVYDEKFTTSLQPIYCWFTTNLRLVYRKYQELLNKVVHVQVWEG